MCSLQELAETCDQLRDEVLRGLELSEKARFVLTLSGVCVDSTLTCAG